MINTADCQTCQWADIAPDGSMATCKAFPVQIPEPILRGQVHHDRPFPGDHGVLYTPIRGSQGEGTSGQVPDATVAHDPVGYGRDGS